MGIKIKSITDVITNSSSETFIVKKPQEYTLRSFQRSLEDFTEERNIHRFDLPYDTYDAMPQEVKETWNRGYGDIDVYDQDYFENPYMYYDIPEGVDKFFVVDIDRNLTASIFYLLRNFEVVSSSAFYPVAEKDDKRIKDLWTYEKRNEWEKLEDHPHLPRTKIYKPEIRNIIVSKPDGNNILVYTTKDEKKIKKVLEILKDILPGYTFRVILGSVHEKHIVDFLLPEIIENKLKE